MSAWHVQSWSVDDTMHALRGAIRAALAAGITPRDYPTGDVDSLLPLRALWPSEINAEQGDYAEDEAPAGAPRPGLEPRIVDQSQRALRWLFWIMPDPALPAWAGERRDWKVTLGRLSGIRFVRIAKIDGRKRRQCERVFDREIAKIAGRLSESPAVPADFSVLIEFSDFKRRTNYHDKSRA